MRTASSRLTTLEKQNHRFVNDVAEFGDLLKTGIPTNTRINTVRTFLLAWENENILLENEDTSVLDEILDKIITL